MKINKRKFFSRMFFFILFISIIVYGVYLWRTPIARENWISLYYSIMAKINKTEITNVETMFSFQYDPAIKTTIVERKDGILVIDKSGIKEYTNSANPVWTKEVINLNPIVDEEEGRFVIAELNGNKLTAYNGKELLWTNEIDGAIQNVTINKEGFVGVIFTRTGYKSGFCLYNTIGQNIYTKMFANTVLIDADIRTDGKFVAMIEADTAGVVVDTVVSCMSEKGDIVYSGVENNTLLTGIRFFDENIIAVGNNKIIKIDKNKEKTVFDGFENKNVSGVNIERERIIEIYRNTDSLFADKAIIEVKDINGKLRGSGEVSGIVKAVETCGRTIAIVLNDRVDFFDINGKYLNSTVVSGDYKNMKLFASGSLVAIQTTDMIKVAKVR